MDENWGRKQKQRKGNKSLLSGFVNAKRKRKGKNISIKLRS